ncbi:porin [Methylobacillus flagellatus]|uniref:porin n=1 Tax=Methylobacillus flagellatus TaxID=405 RepID=UPI0010F7A47E|nr:porin [Methylobacillus flagellatus]
MNKKLGLAVAGAVMAFGASAANAGIIIPAGDWTLDIGGNVNTFYTYNKCDRNSGIAGATACLGQGGVDDNQTNITTGLLPNYLSVSGKTRQNDLDVGFTISLQPGSSTNNSLNQGSQQENRQAFVTFGDASWGTIKLGKDLGIFGSDAILNDMTLLGVGGGGFLSGNTTTIGGIGTGYLYADWKAQVSYMSPNWNGFSFAAGVMTPWNNQALNGDALIGSRSAPGFEGKVNYEWAGDVAGKIWASFITQKLEDLGPGGILGDETARGFDVGATVKFAGFGLTGYYYDGKGIGTTGFLLGAVDAAGNRRDSDGGYVQATYALPGIGTKLGASYGVSNLDNNAADAGANLVKKNERWTIGAYHPLTKHLNLVLEYSQLDSESHLAGTPDSEQKTIAAGAILFF